MSPSLRPDQTAPVRTHAGPVRRAALLVEEPALDAVRVALQRQRPRPQVRQQHRRDPRVVVDHVALGEPGARVHQLVEVRQRQRDVAHRDLDALGLRHGKTVSGYSVAMSSPERRLDRYLHEALALERTLITTLEAHLVQTPPGTYRRLLERHLLQTRAHVVALSSRLDSPNRTRGRRRRARPAPRSRRRSRWSGRRWTCCAARRTRARRCSRTPRPSARARRWRSPPTTRSKRWPRPSATTRWQRLARAHRPDEERMLADLRALIPELTAGRTARPALPIAGDDDRNAGPDAVARLRRRRHADHPRPPDRRGRQGGARL